jgi:lysyl-tRNA synthetase class 2
MTDWQPLADMNVAILRARMLDDARQFFRGRNVLETSTPTLSRSAVSDPQIESIAARLQLGQHAQYFLRTSPEFCMKRLLSAGYPDIYEIGTVFRDGEAGLRHLPEFTLVEWYRRGFGLQRIIDDTLAFIRSVWGDTESHIPVELKSYRDAFLEVTGVDPLTADIETLIRVSDADNRLSTVIGQHRDDWLDLILAQKIVPGFATDRLTVLYQYPASQAALAQLSADDPSTADRFEVFFADLELANGYVELTDADEHMKRFEKDQLERKMKGLAERPLDRNFLAAVEAGLPDCAGVAVGFDRLLMIAADITDIRRVQTFADLR